MPAGSNSPQDRPSPDTTSPQTPPPSESVVYRIADTDECDPADLPPLYEAIDPDALNALYAHGAPVVQFEYAGYRITITPEQVISVEQDD